MALINEAEQFAATRLPVRVRVRKPTPWDLIQMGHHTENLHSNDLADFKNDWQDSSYSDVAS